MSPQKLRNATATGTLQFAIGQCSLGAVLVAESGHGIRAILLGDDAETLLHNLQDCFPLVTLEAGNAAFAKRVAQVLEFIDTPARGLALPLDIQGTAFQQRVWQALREIPAGTTASYSDIASQLGSPKSVRAVAGACAANVLAVAIPCHRVVKADGSLSGYRWGVERKRALLAREKITPACSA